MKRLALAMGLCAVGCLAWSMVPRPVGDEASCADRGSSGELLACFLKWFATEEHGSRQGPKTSPSVFVAARGIQPRFGSQAEPTPADTYEMVWRAVHRRWSALERATWDALVTEDASPPEVEALLAPCHPADVGFVSPQEEADIFRARDGRGWERAHQRFPALEVLVYLAHVAVSQDGRQALVYAEWFRGPLDAGGVIALLVRTDGAWEVVGTYEPWIA